MTESPIESTLLACLEKYVDPNLRIKTQHWVNTPWGNFRIDITVFPKNGPGGIAFECDGKGYHDSTMGSGTFGTYLSTLRTLQLIEGTKHALRASDELFGE